MITKTPVKVKSTPLALFLGFVLLLLLVTNCRPSQELSVTYCTLPASGWKKEAPVEIPFLITEAKRPYRIDVLIRHNNEYDYNNIVLHSSIANQWGYERIDTLSIPLAIESGRWSGRGITLRENSFVFFRKISFPTSGIYTMRLAPLTPLPALKGIENIGIVCQPYDKQSDFLEPETY
ncbi:gliding motility lipoprotein GldH [Porphyromonas gingivicanis]|uniref:gliding motility lipoprotein GldH n=1 Tax=Porphyromonas gingivicanis TaxID=266762 RepID=UPI0006890204|nr:gliding motility lipoprotein GldH [Porphyromonas gingivicanis]